MTYTTQEHWKNIQEFLPEKLHLTAENMPQADSWDWQEHKVYIEHYRNAAAPAKIILFHGVGTNARQMTMIAGAPLAARGYEVIALDMPTYGVTQVAKNAKVVYDDWVNLADDFIKVEQAKDDRPIFLYGLSAGGMLAYHVAAKNRQIAGIIGMTFLDQRDAYVRDKTSRNLFMSRVGVPSASLMAKTPLAGMKIPMWLASKMNKLVNNEQALKVFMRDKSSAGNSASFRFLSSYMHYQPAIEPQNFMVCPILLTQPAEDRWTPLELSERFFKSFDSEQTSIEIVMLENAGHYPLEQPGLDQLIEAIDGFVQKHLKP